MNNNNLLTGNDFLDALTRGAYKDNPEYNPKTKAGRSQPPVLVDTTPGDINSGMITNSARALNNIRFTTRDTGMDNERLVRDEDLGLIYSPYNTEEELTVARAEAQSNWAKAGNALMQAGVGEIVLGTFEGFGNIADGIINSFTGNNYGVNPYTKFMSDIKDKLTDEFQIYRRNPNASWDVSDFGWWAQNAVSVATTASLLLPAAGWARGLSYVGKLTRINKGLQALNKYTSRAIARVGKSRVGNNFNSLRNLANKSNRIERTIGEGSEIIGTALLSRTGENYMEAKSIYEDVYTNSKENLDNMPDEEFTKFIINNPEFKNMSKDDIAKEIARKSANTTFYGDYLMLVMDIPQFKAIGRLWGRVGRRATTASERIAAENIRRTLAGKSTEELLKDNIWNRSKEGLRYALKNPKQSLAALELGEGVEEMYQGIQSERGMETAEHYFNPAMTPRTISSYLSDGSIWEQGFWGVLGGIAFNKIGRGLQSADKAIRGAWNKKHMTAEQYEAWKRSDIKISVERLKNITANIDEFVNNMNTIQNGENPFNVLINPETGNEIVINGEYANRTIDEKQAELLKQKALSKFVDQVTMDSMDDGTFDLMKEILNSSEFDQYIAKNGLHLNSNDKSIVQQVVARMDKISDLYETTIKDVDSLADTTNPFITKAVARNIVRNKIQLQQYNDNIANIDSRLLELEDRNYHNYETQIRQNVYKEQLKKLANNRKRLEQNRKEGKITESEYQEKLKEINKLIDVTNRWGESTVISNVTKDIFDELTQKLSLSSQEYSEATNEDLDFDSIINNFLKRYGESSDSSLETPPQQIADLIEEKIQTEKLRNYTEVAIPTNQQEYADIYNEFSRSMDAMELARRKEYVERVKNWISAQENLDDAIKKIYAERTGNENVDEALHYLRYRTDNAIDLSLSAEGQTRTNMELESILITERMQRDTAAHANTEAEKEGVGTPPATPPSTGDSTRTDTTGTTRTTTPPPTSERTTTETNLSEGDERLNNPMRIEGGVDTFDESYDTDSLRGEIKARQYVMQVGFKNEYRLNEITESLAKGDTSKRDALLNEITNYLVQQGFELNLARHLAGSAFKATINLFGSTNPKSAFGKLAQQLAIGFSKKAAEKMSTTELLDGKALDETVDEFLTEYIKVSKNDSIGGKYIINIESLFDYLLNNENVDIRTAMYIYNNLSQFIAKNDGSKYIFTGFNTASNNMLSAVDFINRLQENKAQLRNEQESLHISPIELRQRSDKKSNEEYREALLHAHNGTAEKVYIEPQRDKDGNMTNLNVVVQYKKGKQTKTVKVGILRTIKMSSDGNTVFPISHQSGFRNAIRNFNQVNVAILDCDGLFSAIISRADKDGKQLWEDIASYYLQTRQIIDRRYKGLMTFEEARKALSETMTKEMAERIMNNPYIKDVIAKSIYKFDVGVANNDIAKARDISSKIAAILFFGREDDVNNNHNNFATDEIELFKRYIFWSEQVRINYQRTYEFQQAIENGDATPIIKRLSVGYYTNPNIINDPKQYKNISELEFEHDPTARNYNPLIYVKNGRLIGEDGTDYGEASPYVSDYSMGYITYRDNNLTFVSYFQRANEIKDSDIANAAKGEVRRLILAQLYNSFSADNPGLHEDTFKNIGDLLTELCGFQGLFKLGNHFNEGDVTVRISNNGEVINITHYDRKTKRTKPIMAFFAYDSVHHTPGNAIRIFGPNYDAKTNSTDYVDIYSINGSSTLSKEDTEKWIDYALNEMFKSVKINRSSLGITKRTNSGGTASIFDWNPTAHKFTLHLNGKDYNYSSYAEFVTNNNGFTINVYQNEDGSFVTRTMNPNRISINTGIRENVPNTEQTNNAVSDMLYTNEANPKRVTADTEDILTAAGVEQDKIDILLGTNNGLQIATKRVSISPEKGDAFMYYDDKDKRIHITPKGAVAMNGNPKNAVRLILHENIHRHFNSRKFTNAERQRIIDELQAVYDFVRAKIEEEHNNGNLSDNLYNAFVSVLDKTQSYDSQQVRMEEFLVECLTQAPLTEWLNNTEYGIDADITGIAPKKKSILQKIIDVILDLLGIKDSNIKNNSILAREYVILSKGINPTALEGVFTPVANTGSASTKSPVEGTSAQRQTAKDKTTETLDKTKAKIDTIRADFEARITRSPNFDEDHTYLLDGKPVDYSVTQKIHGKQDIGKWGTPASTLGNTADAAARGYFDNNGVVTDDMKIPNVSESQREELIADMSKIEAHLDEKFGKGRYRVITQEFPIGGTITINGKVKTIAGTMDMLVYTDTGDIYIYDFKTKRIGNSDGNISAETLIGYKQQVNIYRQLIEENYLELKGRIHTGSLIKFNVDYPEPTNTIKYRTNPNNNSQLQISRDGGNTYENIQDALIDYMPPTLADEYNNSNVIIPVEQQDYGDEIGPLPELSNDNINNASPIITSLEDVGLNSEGYLSDDDIIDDYEPDDYTRDAVTEQITDNGLNSSEIYAPAIALGATGNAYGVRIVNSTDEFINEFPTQYQDNIKLLLDSSELNYTCQ